VNQESNHSKSVEAFARGLLATTCLTVACSGSAVAGAITVTEGQGGAPTDFPDSPNGYLLPLGTTVVNGAVGPGQGVEGGFDPADFFEFQGLTPGSTATFTGVFVPLGNEAGIFYTVFNDIGTVLAVGSFETCCDENNGNTNSITVPGDGNVVFEAYSRRSGEEGGGGGHNGTAAYQVTLNAEAATTPEPAALGLTGLGLGAVALGWRRKRSR
jgi:hypothetical protein